MGKTTRVLLAAVGAALLAAGAGCVTIDVATDVPRSSPAVDQTDARPVAPCPQPAPTEVPLKAASQTGQDTESSARVDALMARARQMRAERQFAEAADVLEEVLRIDPDNARARDQLGIARDYLTYLDDGETQLALSWSQRTPIIAPEEKPGIWTWYGMWPRNWLELTQQSATPGGNVSHDWPEHGTRNNVE